VEGHTYKYIYKLNSGATLASALQIVRNYQNAARAAGGQILWESGEGNWRATTVRFRKGAGEVWMEVEANSGPDQLYRLNVVERQAMQQDVVVDAKSMADGLAATGHVEVPGIFFDTAKSVLKPESDAAIKEIAKLLQATPALKLWVVGHTGLGRLARGQHDALECARRGRDSGTHAEERHRRKPPGAVRQRPLRARGEQQDRGRPR
jgi:outer membrane protein OmpA-like peptidoglycan-associated protein